MSPVLGAHEFRRAILASLESLRARRADIDAVNVYPVPDADTGTNLVMTFEAIAQALARAGDSPPDVARAAKEGALHGARGNAGVIAAQFLRGLVEAVEGGPADPARLARAFERARDLAYEAVLEPAEGTILSVARASAEAAGAGHSDVGGLLEASAAAAREALERTPEQLAVLARAGVVDAGGLGLVVILDAFAGALGRARPPLPSYGAARCENGRAPPAFAYEVMYLLRASDAAIPRVRSELGAIGDSVAISGGEGAWRVHVHTDDTDRAVAIGAAVGAVSGTEVVSFAEQVAPNVPSVGPAGGAEPAPGERGLRMARPREPASLLAVVAGAGVRRLYEELGARVLEGAPGRVPSADALLAAVEGAPAGEVILLPNNEDAFGNAVEVLDRTAKRLHLLRTGDVAQGLVVAVAYGDARPAEECVAEMRATLERVRSGQVVVAPAPMETPKGTVSPGEHVGFADGAVTAFGRDPVVVAVETMTALSPARAVVTVLCGEGVGAEERERLTTSLRNAAPQAIIEVHDGGQPLHRYLLAVE